MPQAIDPSALLRVCKTLVAIGNSNPKGVTTERGVATGAQLIILGSNKSKNGLIELCRYKVLQDSATTSLNSIEPLGRVKPSRGSGPALLSLSTMGSRSGGFTVEA